jgi:hypothetical protein
VTFKKLHERWKLCTRETRGIDLGADVPASAMQIACSKYLTQRILSSGGLFSVESMPGRAAATLLNS